MHHGAHIRPGVARAGGSSKVPLTLVNTCPTPLTVRVRLSSPKLRLSQPDTVAEVTDRYQFEIPVEARTNGVFVVTVELFTPAGSGGPAQPAGDVHGRGQALTGLGQVITAALLLVLVDLVDPARPASPSAGTRPPRPAPVTLPAHPSGGGEAG